MSNVNISVSTIFKLSKKYVNIDADKCVGFPLSEYQKIKNHENCKPDTTITFNINFNDVRLDINVQEKRRVQISKLEELLKKNVVKQFIGYDRVARLNIDRTLCDLVI